MNPDLLEAVTRHSRAFVDDGFCICAVFGSRARGDHNSKSDLDLLYVLSQSFYEKFAGLRALERLEEIRTTLSRLLGFRVDLANLHTLSAVGKKHILPDAIFLPTNPPIFPP